jgi:hypothetical protein
MKYFSPFPQNIVDGILKTSRFSPLLGVKYIGYLHVIHTLPYEKHLMSPLCPPVSSSSRRGRAAHYRWLYVLQFRPYNNECSSHLLWESHYRSLVTFCFPTIGNTNVTDAQSWGGTTWTPLSLIVCERFKVSPVLPKVDSVDVYLSIF